MTEFREDRYKNMSYRHCGKSGLKLSALSLGLWHNFGDGDDLDIARQMCFLAFDNGITHFDIANNYGPPPGSAERNFSEILKEMPRDELVISTKAGYYMHPGPYGDRGSKKSLVTSCDQSLRRTGLDYFDIFYHHNFDPDTPIEECMAAIEQIVRQGKALYAGISNHTGEQTERAAQTLLSLSNGRVPLTIQQPRYNLFDRKAGTDLLPVADRLGVGVIPFCPLAQGLLTGRYLKGIPDESRAAGSRFLREDRITEDYLVQARALNDIAADRGQNLAQMALAWILRDPRITSVLIGASRPEQIEQNIKALANVDFSEEELEKIDRACGH